MVAAADTQQSPSVVFKDPDEVFAGELLHTAISSTRCFPSILAGSTSTERQASTAS
jgi:hypothetical protein